MTVRLVGAGPGDPGLITVRGLELLRGCDALVYDRLAAPELVDEAPDDALRIPHDGRSQDEVNGLLVGLGRQGLEVVRLKGGDPFVFGRGGEEALALSDAGVPFEIVPGVSALAAVPAAAGIPLTHRGVSAQVHVIAARTALGGPEWEGVRPGATVVVFMGLKELPAVCAALVEHGLDPATPAAAISRGTRPDQQVVIAELERLPVAAAALPGPALVVVGDVVGLAAQLRKRTLASAVRAG